MAGKFQTWVSRLFGRPVKLHDQYEILGKIGAGGFGFVYKARDTHLDEVVAIKELRLEDPDALRAEAKVLSKLRHENVVGFRQLFPEGDRWYMVLDFVEGGSLGSWIDKGALYRGGHEEALVRIVSIAVQFAQGLSYAHKHEVVHQDVKPGNLLLTPQEVAKVSDFGLARARPLATRSNSGDVRQSIAVTGRDTSPLHIAHLSKRGAKS